MIRETWLVFLQLGGGSLRYADAPECVNKYMRAYALVMAAVDCKVYNRFGVPRPFCCLILGIYQCNMQFAQACSSD